MSELRAVATLSACARCGASCFLRVAPVREHGRGGAPTPMAVTYREQRRDLGPFARAVECVGPRIELVPEGRYVVIVCRGCGDTRWFARDLSDKVLAELPHSALGTCAECGDSRSLRVGRARTRGHGGEPSELRVLSWISRRWGFATTGSGGHFSTFVCRGCGRTSWIAGALHELPLEHRTTTGHAPCLRCTGTLRLGVDPVNEDGATLRVLYERRHLHEMRVGRYALSICMGCGITDWRASDIEALCADDSLGVAELSAGEGHALGPYR